MITCLDLDRNGVRTPGVDPVYTNRFTGSTNVVAMNVKIGDRDGDGVGDVDEYREGAVTT